jgi:hypothetical protein
VLWQETGPVVEQPVARGKSRAKETSTALARSTKRRDIAIRAVKGKIMVAGKIYVLPNCPVHLYPSPHHCANEA